MTFWDDAEDAIFKILLWLGSIVVVVAVVHLFFSFVQFDNRRSRPKHYNDTVSLLLPTIRDAKSHFVKVNDRERYEYWANLETELVNKVLEEKAGE